MNDDLTPPEGVDPKDALRAEMTLLAFNVGELDSCREILKLDFGQHLLSILPCSPTVH